jgi:hypothetical protein
MTPVDAYVEDLVAALDIKGSRLDSTRVAKVPNYDFLAKLRRATFGYLASPAALSTNARLLDGEYEVPRERWTHSRMGSGQVIHTELVNGHIDQAVANGQLFVIDSIDECDPLLMRLREAIEYRLRARAWINVYLTAAGQENFGLHSDTHDTVIIQLFGKKVWHVDSTSRGVPPGTAIADLREHRLCVPDVLAIAGDTAHHVTGIGELTLHLTIGFDRDTGLTYRLREIDDLVGRNSPAISDHDRAYGMAMTKDRRTGTSLPFSSTHDMEHCRLVRWSSRLPPLVEEGPGGRIVVTSMGRQHTYSGGDAELVRHLSEGKELNVEELLSTSGLTLSHLKSFLIDAIDDGVLICRDLFIVSITEGCQFSSQKLPSRRTRQAVHNTDRSRPLGTRTAVSTPRKDTF